MDLRSAEWGLLVRHRGPVPFIELNDDLVLVLFHFRYAEVFERHSLLRTGGLISAERLSDLDATTLLSALIDLDRNELRRLEDFCREPQTKKGIAAAFPALTDVDLLVEAQVLRHVGQLGRAFTFAWQGYTLESILAALERPIINALDAYARLHPGTIRMTDPRTRGPNTLKP